jgi:DNA-binding CsgD family transcriptional regulator
LTGAISGEGFGNYGLECLSLSGELEQARHAHAQYYLDYAEEATAHLLGAEQEQWFIGLERAHDNIRAALRWLIEREETGESVEMALRVAGKLRWFWSARGHMSEGRAFLEKALSKSAKVVTSTRGMALFSDGMLAWSQGDNGRADSLCRESLLVYQELKDQHGISYASPNDLSEREVEVLRLVARGLSDAQVAELLVISPRTVNAHLRSIYSKLNITSRHAATLFALEQRLI